MNERTQAKAPNNTIGVQTPMRAVQPPQAAPEYAVERPDIDVQLASASQRGHSLGTISVSNTGAAINQTFSSIQRQPAAKEDEEENLQMQRQENPEEDEEKPPLQRQSDTLQNKQGSEEEDDQESLQMQPESDSVQREEVPEEDEEKTAQMKRDDTQMSAEGGKVSPMVESAIHRARGGGQPMEESVQAQMSQSLGHNFSGVRVHTGTEADTLNQQLSAKAFATGRDIFFRQNMYNPASSSGRELLAHELTHVVQQSTGQVQGGGSGMTTRPAGDAFEKEADTLAKQMLPYKQAVPQASLARPTQGIAAIQRGFWSGLRRKITRSYAHNFTGYTIWSSGRAGSINNLVISSHGGDSTEEPLYFNNPRFRVHFYAAMGSTTDAQLSAIGSGEITENNEQVDGHIRNYSLSKYQYSGGGPETYEDVCRFVKGKGDDWGVLTIHKGVRTNYVELNRKGAFGGVTHVHALHCRGARQQVHMVTRPKKVGAGLLAELTKPRKPSDRS